MMPSFRTVVLVFGALLAPTALQAAGDPAAPGLQPMTVAIVRDDATGCEPNCAEWIAASGKIVPGTAARFEHVLRQMGARRLPVLISSGGGLVPEAMAIGRRIRALHLDVAVARTDSAPCGPADRGCRAAAPNGSMPGRAAVRGAFCASACVLVLAAGEKRHVASWTPVGVHQLIMHETLVRTRRLYRLLFREQDGVRHVVSRTLVSEKPVSSRMVLVQPSQHVYDDVERYLLAMGITPELETLMRGTPPSGLHWMTAAETHDTNLATDRLDGEMVVAATELAMRPASTVVSTVDDRPAEPAFVVHDADSAGNMAVKLGHVTWTLDMPADPRRAAIVAKVAVPDDDLGLILRLDKINPADAGSARISIDFQPVAAPTTAAVTAIGMPRSSEFAAHGDFLIGTVVKEPQMRFVIVLKRYADVAAANWTTIRSWPWLSFTLVFADGRTASLRLKHGPAEDALLDRLFKAWGTLPTGATGARA